MGGGRGDSDNEAGDAGVQAQRRPTDSPLRLRVDKDLGGGGMRQLSDAWSEDFPALCSYFSPKCSSLFPGFLYFLTCPWPDLVTHAVTPSHQH